MTTETAEHRRLADSESRKADWKNWGPYLADRAWATVREDYSPDGDAWNYFPHDHSRSRAYRWNEDAIGGFCNRHQNVCLGLGLWNTRDPIIKERFFGLTGPEGNHGEDVKEHYYYLDSTPTHSYARMLYKYPQVEYPYDWLVGENGRRSKDAREFELEDAIGRPLSEGRYFDVFIEYAKADEEDILCRITAINRSGEAAPLHILPHIWFRNRWSWGYEYERPELTLVDGGPAPAIRLEERHLGTRWWYVQVPGGQVNDFLFTENDTNTERLFDAPNESEYVKDGINDRVVEGETDRVNPEQKGTKAAAHVILEIGPGESETVEIRFSPVEMENPFGGFDDIIEQRKEEADEFYSVIQRDDLSSDEKIIQRQAFAGLMWTKQFYHFSVELWLNGDPKMPDPPPRRRSIRNTDWEHLYNLDVISMPDTWEYPWYAAWDLAFHTLPIAMIDPEWAKRQLILMTREWYMHPNGQLPAYEWSFSDVNPPVHAWAAWRVYKIDRDLRGEPDTEFLERIFHKMLLNFTWWVNRKDADGHNVFQGGFLGLDNIGVFDRSAPLPTGGHLDQADATAWMAMYCLNMLTIALELAGTRSAYEDIASKFFEHFVYIAHAINRPDGIGLWDEEEGFYFDAVHVEHETHPLKVFSFVGLIPLFACEAVELDLLEKLPRFKRRVEWFQSNRSELMGDLTLKMGEGEGNRCLLSLVDENQLKRILNRMLSEEEFLSTFGLRSLSKRHENEPYEVTIDGFTHTVRYEPAESTSGLFGGNSNWRGPIWLPLNFLMVEALQRFHHYFGDRMKVPMPSGAQSEVTLDRVASDLSQRLIGLFTRDPQTGDRPFYGSSPLFQDDPDWNDYLLFHEYFHGETGRGLGASHQTGWTALVAKLIQQCGGS